MDVGPQALDLFHTYEFSSFESKLELHPHVALD